MNRDIRNVLTSFEELGYTIFDGYIHIEIKGNHKEVIINKMTLGVFVKVPNITIKESLLISDLLDITNRIKKDKR